MDEWHVDLAKENVVLDVGDLVVCLLFVVWTYSLRYGSPKLTFG